MPATWTILIQAKESPRAGSWPATASAPGALQADRDTGPSTEVEKVSFTHRSIPSVQGWHARRRLMWQGKKKVAQAPVGEEKLFLWVFGCQESVRGGGSGKGPAPRAWREGGVWGWGIVPVFPWWGRRSGESWGDFWGLCILPSSKGLNKTSKAHSSQRCQGQAFTVFLQQLLPRWGRFPGSAGNRSRGQDFTNFANIPEQNILRGKSI